MDNINKDLYKLLKHQDNIDVRFSNLNEKVSDAEIPSAVLLYYSLQVMFFIGIISMIVIAIHNL